MEHYGRYALSATITSPMPEPASNDPIDPDAIGGGSEAGLRRARTVLRWVIVAALAVALALFYALTASAGELTGKVIRVGDGDTITVLDAGNKQTKIRVMGIDAPEKGQPFGNKVPRSPGFNGRRQERHRGMAQARPIRPVGGPGVRR